MFGFLTGLIGVHFRPDPKWPTPASDKYDIKGAGQKERSLGTEPELYRLRLAASRPSRLASLPGKVFWFCFFFKPTGAVVRNHGDSGFKN